MTPFERVKLSRERTAATFPLPSPVDCIRYAITELAEYDDALLRQERTGDKRNNDKAHSAERELGQALYMLLSAAMQWDLQPHYVDVGVFCGRLGCYAYTARMTAWLLDDWQTIAPLNSAYSGMGELVALHGWDVDALIDATCADFERKHAEVTA